MVFPNTKTGVGIKGGECVKLHYIDENGEVSDYEDGTDIIGSDLYEWADAM